MPPGNNEKILGKMDDSYNNRVFYSQEFIPVAAYVESLNLCSMAQEGCKTRQDENWQDNAKLERNGPLMGKTTVGDVGLEILVSPMQGRVMLSGLDEIKTNKIEEILSPENLPVGLKNIVSLTDIEGKKCINLELLPTGLPKQALVDGFSRELCRLSGVGELPNFEYQKIPDGDQKLDLIDTKFGTLKTNLSFLISRPGDADSPVWTQAAQAFREKSQKAQSIFGIIAEPSGRGKTLISRDIIKNFINSEKCAEKSFGGCNKSRVSQEINQKLLNNFYAYDRVDDILILSPEVKEENEFDFEKVMHDFQDVCSIRSRGTTLLVVDNAQFLSFPKNGDWLNKFEEFLNVLANRQDGSGVLLLAEHMPKGTNESQFQGHRLERIELPFTADDFGLPKGSEKEINENAVGYQLITRNLQNDPRGETYYGIAKRLYPNEDERPPKGFDEAYHNSIKTLSGNMTKALLSHPEIIQMFENKKISNFLSFSHINSVSKNLLASLNVALMDTTSQTWLSIGIDGSVTVKDESKLQSIIDTNATNLISKVTALAEGKIAEEQERNNFPNPPPEEKFISPELTAPPRVEENIFDRISKRRTELLDEKKLLEERIKNNSIEQSKLNTINESLGDFSTEDSEFIVNQQHLVVSIKDLLNGEITDETFMDVLAKTKDQRNSLNTLFSHLGEIMGADDDVTLSLLNLGNTLSSIDNSSDWNRLSFAVKPLISTIKNSKIIEKYDSFYSNYQKAIEYFSQE